LDGITLLLLFVLNSENHEPVCVYHMFAYMSPYSKSWFKPRKKWKNVP